MDPSSTPKIREAIYVPPRPNPGPISVEVPVSNAMTVAVGVTISLCALLLLATRSRRGPRAGVSHLASAGVPTAERRVAVAVRRVRDAAATLDPSRLSGSRTTEELAADTEVLCLMGEETGVAFLDFLASCDRARYSEAMREQDVERLEAWSSELVGEIRRRVTAGASSRIKGK